jgi:PAS domain S-box-containing protein
VPRHKTAPGLGPAELHHELEVHRVELEMQNDELRRAHLELEESRDRYYELYDLAPVAYVTLDSVGRIVETNLTTAQLLGVGRARLVGRPLSTYLFPDEADRYHRFLMNVTRSTEKQSDDFDLQAASGRIIRAHIEAVAVPAQGRRGLTCRCVIIDLSALRQAERRLHESEERFRQIADAIDDVFYVRERDGKFSYLSPAFEDMFRASADTVLQTGSGWMSMIDREDRARLMRAEARLLAEGRMFDVGYRVSRQGSVRFLRHRAYPVLDREGEVLKTVGVVHDATIERELEEQLRQAQKMEAIGSLASGVAHDFNNVLQAVLGLATMALAEDSTPSDVREYVSRIVRAARRGGAVAGRLMSFARRDAAASNAHELDAMVREVVGLLTHLLTENVTLEVDLRAPDAFVLAETSQLEQILMNLGANARDAMPQGGKLRIETSIVSSSELRGVREAERYVRMRVTDTGAGIDEATLRRIFEPFFTTKSVGRGTGLGLASVLALTRQMGGDVQADSEIGRGTTFTFEFPACDVTPAVVPERPSRPGVLGGKALLVEDEPAIRMAVHKYLEELGLEVVEAANGEEAQRRFIDSQGAFRLLVTDIVMPGMMGTVLANQLQERRPDLRVLFITANPQGIMAERSAPGRALLRKPFTKDDLASKLGELVS